MQNEVSEESELIATVGKTSVKIKEVVRDARGIEEVVKLAIEHPDFGWPERRLQQVECRLRIYPSARDLKDWDSFLLGRYSPLHVPQSETCTDCSLGPCDLSTERGACGSDMRTKCARDSLLAACRGASQMISHARELLDEALKRFGRDEKISHGRNVRYPSICTMLFTGKPIYTLDDADDALKYAERQLSELLAAATAPGELDVLDLECKAMHAGSMFLLAAEVAELVKESCFGLCSAADQDLVDLPNFPHFIERGVGALDLGKPVILFLGNSFLAGIETIELVKERGLEDEIQICGVGQMGFDLGRRYERVKHLGGALKALRVVRAGVADVIVVGEQCVHLNILEEAKKARTAVIAVSSKLSMGLDDMTGEETSKIVEMLVGGEVTGVLILNPDKAAEVAIETARALSKRREKLMLPGLSDAARCNGCGVCDDACPNALEVSEAVLAAKGGDAEKLKELYDSCWFCARCEGVCPENIPIMSLILSAAKDKMRAERFKMRPGRGTPVHLEYRDVAYAFGFGTVSGMVAIIGCSAYPGSEQDVGYMVNELVDMNYLVLTAGCCAADIASFYNEVEKKHIYEAWPALLQLRNFLNCGSCSAFAHVARAFIKYNHLIARLPLLGNFEEHADYTLGKMPMGVIIWGPATDLVYAAALGLARMGVAVVLGPHGWKFRHFMPGNVEDRSRWWAYDGFTGRKVETDPAPPHMIVPVETKEEALTMITRLVFRVNDFRDGRMSKMDSYWSFYERFFRSIPEDFHLYVRADAELPWSRKHKMVRILGEKYGWEVDRRRGVILKYKHRDGRLLPLEEYTKEYGIKVGQYSTFLERLILKPEARGELAATEGLTQPGGMREGR